MKLNYSQLEAHLTKKFFPVYLVSGDEFFLKQDALQLLRKKAKQVGFIEHVRLINESGFDWGELHHLLHANSLLAEKRIVECDFRDSIPNKIATNILLEYSEHHSPDLILIISMGKMDAKVTKSAWYQALDKIGVTIPIWPITRDQLPKWIISRAKKYQLTLTQDAANLLADYVEGNLIAAAQTVEKIYLLGAPTTINSDIIQNILTDESHFTIFDFTESLIAGRSNVFHILERLRVENVEPTLILWAITRELRLLTEMAQQIKQGQTYDALFQKNRIFPRRQPAIKRFIEKNAINTYLQLLSQAAEIDKMIKGALPGNVWQAFHLFCLRLVEA